MIMNFLDKRKFSKKLLLNVNKETLGSLRVVKLRNGGSMNINMLITDGANKNSLAILRTLGNDPNDNYLLNISTPYNKYLTLSYWSKYCSNVHHIKTQINTSIWDIDPYAQELLEIIEKESYDVMIPVGLKSNIAVSKFLHKFLEQINTIAPPYQSMKIAFNKDLTFDYAKNIGISIPETKIYYNSDELNNINDFPRVIKTSDGLIRYCNNKMELNKIIEILKKKSKCGNIISQEYITGYGCGFYAVYNNGNIISNFAHKRLLEFPITGGPSAIAESYFDDRLLKIGRKVCDGLQWNGPIMVEFKYDINTDKYVLIEINPKLWGSLDLTIASGVNIPKILTELSLGKEVTPNLSYKYIKYRWLFPDEFFARISAQSIKSFSPLLYNQDNTKTNFDQNDIAPFIFQVVRSIFQSPRVIINRYPHGQVVFK